MNKNDFTSFAKRHFAQKLNIDENKVEELYEFVNTHFAIEVTDNQFCSPNKQLRYTATLVYEESGDYGRDMRLMSFGNKELGGEGAFYDEFPTKEAALQAAAHFSPRRRGVGVRRGRARRRHVQGAGNRRNRRGNERPCHRCRRASHCCTFPARRRMDLIKKEEILCQLLTYSQDFRKYSILCSRQSPSSWMHGPPMM